MAVAGPDYQCFYADVGTNGPISDGGSDRGGGGGGFWNKCGLAAAMEDGSLSLFLHTNAYPLEPNSSLVFWSAMMHLHLNLT